MRVLSDFHIRILSHIAKKEKRWEPTMCVLFGCNNDCHSMSEVEDALFFLVRKGFVEWFGSNDKPLWYKVTNKGRGYIKKLRGYRASSS